jgi:hypothetical protein
MENETPEVIASDSTPAFDFYEDTQLNYRRISERVSALLDQFPAHEIALRRLEPWGMTASELVDILRGVSRLGLICLRANSNPESATKYDRGGEWESVRIRP